MAVVGLLGCICDSCFACVAESQFFESNTWEGSISTSRGNCFSFESLLLKSKLFCY